MKRLWNPGGVEQRGRALLIALGLGAIALTASGCGSARADRAASLAPMDVSAALEAATEATPQPTMPVALPQPREPEGEGAALEGATLSSVAPDADAGLAALEAVAEPASAAAEEAPVPPAVFLDYTVVAGDTLLGLAMAHGLPMAAIQLQNDLGPNTMIRVGQVLRIPPPIGWEAASPFWIAYEVAAGDTLSGIAAAYGLSLAEMQGVNGLTDVDRLAIGQMLVLPLRGPVDAVLAANRPQATPTAPAALPTPTPSAEVAAAEPTPAPTTAPPPQPAPVVTGDMAALSQQIFQLVNAERAKYGLPPLLWNDTLARAAQRHADDCHARGWCSHTGSDGSTMRDRIIREGYNPVRWSECWAWYGSAEQAVAMWMNETPPNDPHRRTILSTYLTEVGVGVVPGNPRGYYFIANFGTPR